MQITKTLTAITFAALVCGCGFGTQYDNYIFWNQTGRTFYDPASLYFGKGATTRISVGNFNTDSKSDLLVCFDNGFRMFVGTDTSPYFALTHDRMRAKIRLVSATLTDYNNDGFLDIVALSDDTLFEPPSDRSSKEPLELDTITCFSGDGSGFPRGVFESTLSEPLLIGSQFPKLIQVDVDQDGLSDLAFYSSQYDEIELLRNTGASSYELLEPLELSVGLPREVFTANLDSDAFPEIIAGYSPVAGKTKFDLWKSDASGNYIRTTLTINYLSDGLLAGEFTNDGITDLLLWRGDSIYINYRILIGDGGGGFVESSDRQTLYVRQGLLSGGYAIDVDRDGYQDILLSETVRSADGDASAAVILYGSGTGAFTAQRYAMPGIANSTITGELYAPADYVGSDYIDLLFFRSYYSR